jgi:hypothetical protein
MSLSAEWFGIIITGSMSCFAIYFNFRKKSKLIITATAKKNDHHKGKNAAIHPVNELIISIVNTSLCPITIKDIVFVYREKDDQTKFVYDNFSFKKREQVIKKP